VTSPVDTTEKEIIMDDTTKKNLLDAEAQLMAAIQNACLCNSDAEFAKHAARVKLYQEKEAGRKITEEAIRSEAYIATADKTLDAQKASADLEIARAHFRVTLVIAQGNGFATCDIETDTETNTDI